MVVHQSQAVRLRHTSQSHTTNNTVSTHVVRWSVHGSFQVWTGLIKGTKSHFCYSSMPRVAKIWTRSEESDDLLEYETSWFPSDSLAVIVVRYWVESASPAHRKEGRHNSEWVSQWVGQTQRKTKAEESGWVRPAHMMIAQIMTRGCEDKIQAHNWILATLKYLIKSMWG